MCTKCVNVCTCTCECMRVCLCVCVRRLSNCGVAVCVCVCDMCVGVYVYVWVECVFYCMSACIKGEVGGWGRDPFSRNLMSPTPRRKWYLTTGRRAH